MPLEGIRAWIGEVERKLGMRTRVFLVLTAIAIGGAGAAIYLALDTRDNAVSEGDVRALQRDLEARIAGGGTSAGTSVGELEADLRALEAKVEALEGGSAGTGGKTGAAGDAPPGTGATAPDGGGEANLDAIAGEGDEAKERLRELLGETKRQNDAAEDAQAAEDGGKGG
jgi:hypothetical protein